MTIVPFKDESGKPVQYMFISNDITGKKLMEKEILAQKVEEQKKMTRAVIQAQEKERNKMGQELHDNVNQILASTRMFLSVALNSKKLRRDLVEESTGMLDNAIQEIRLLSKNQITPQGKLGLRELIQLLADSLNENSKLETTFEYQISAGYVEIETDLKLNIYRIIQEQLNNILKHAEASHVSILLQSDGESITVRVRDDGKGFETDQSRKGIGITNMINRVESFNGEFSIESAPGNGCTLTIRIPIR
jgi:signal transduction histidine kinase